MKFEIKIDKTIKKDTVILTVNELNSKITKLIELIEGYDDQNRIIGIIDKEKYILNLENIVRFYSLQKKIIATDKDNKEYVVKFYLYELDELLNKNFIRISNSEIINLDYVEKIDTSFYGSIKLKTTTGLTTYVTRSYLKYFKDKLGGQL